jgi:hypothetical protein
MPSFDTIRTAWEAKKLRGYTDAQAAVLTHEPLNRKWRGGDTQAGGQTQKDTQTDSKVIS